MSVSLTAESVMPTVNVRPPMTSCSFTWSSWSLMESACEYVNSEYVNVSSVQW